MTSVQEVPQRAREQGRRHGLLAGLVGLLGVAVCAAAVVASWPLFVAAGLLTVIILGFVLSRLDLAVAVLAAGFFFNAYLAHGIGILTVDKAIGAIAVGSWGLDWALNRRPVVTSRGLWLLCAFLLWTAVSFGLASNDTAASVTSLRYVTFAILYFLVLQTVRGDRRRADVLVRVVVVAAAVASIIGLIAFFTGHVTRASGPIADPNDFGFILASAVPLVIYQLRWAGTRMAKAFSAIAMALVLACILATFSRSALVGLAVATIWAAATKRLKLRWVVSVVACMAVAAGIALVAAPQLVQNAFGQKAHVATANVDIRLGYYRVELNEWRHFPVAGVGPGNFVYRFYQFAPAAGESLPFPSNVLTISGEEAYLVILAEQGIVGLLLFLGYLAVSWGDLRRRFPGDPRADQLQIALAAGFVVACVGALFLAEQYYPPLWYLPAVGASMASRWRGIPASDRRQVPSSGSDQGSGVQESAR